VVEYNMPARLQSLDDGVPLILDKPIILIGRHPECDIQIESRKISRRHCCVAQVNTYLVIRDLDSTNGIRVNGVRVVEGRLKPGDEVTIGNLRYQVSWESHPDLEIPKSLKKPADPAKAPPPAAAQDDDYLESRDEPVALPDPDDDEPPPTGRDSFASILPQDIPLADSKHSHHNGAPRDEPEA
jgi:predicted component of type VI protein secretion system